MLWGPAGGPGSTQLAEGSCEAGEEAPLEQQDPQSDQATAGPSQAQVGQSRCPNRLWGNPSGGWAGGWAICPSNWGLSASWSASSTLLITRPGSLRQDHSDGRSIPARRVSRNQTHIKPSVRDKARCTVALGAKISISATGDEFTFRDRLSLDPYNEGDDLKARAQADRRRYGFYPDVICADQIYRTRLNRASCRHHGSRLDVPRLRRPVLGGPRTIQMCWPLEVAVLR